MMMVRRTRLAALAALMLLAAIGSARDARAAAEVHRFNLVLSANPTSIIAGDVNDRLGVLNRDVLAARGLEAMDEITFGWFYQAELRYFVAQNVAVSAGVGQVRSQSKREFLPAIAQDIQLRAEVLSVPIHVGGAFYLPPYNQGDFQARAYMGAGFMSLVHNRIRYQQSEVGTTSSTTLAGDYGPNYVLTARNDSPGYYGEFGVHMFFPSRFSVMVGAIYRSALVRRTTAVVEMPNPLDPDNLNPDIPAKVKVPIGDFTGLDTGGLGLRMALAIGF